MNNCTCINCPEGPVRMEESFLLTPSDRDADTFLSGKAVIAAATFTGSLLRKFEQKAKPTSEILITITMEER